MTPTPETLVRLNRMRDPAAGAPAFSATLNRHEYDSLPGINASVLKQSTPLEMLCALQSEAEPLKYPLMFGSLVHLAILEPDKFDALDRSEWLVEISTATLKTKEAEKALAENPGKIIATKRMIEKACRAKEAAYRHRQFAELMDGKPMTEVAVQAWDEKHGLWRKGRIDIVPDYAGEKFWIGDIKTTSNDLANLTKLAWTVRDFGYDFQAAYYADLMRMAVREEVANYVFVWLAGPSGESEDEGEPWICRLTSIPQFPSGDGETSLAAMGDKIDRSLSRFTNAITNNDWTAYDNERIDL